MEDQGVTISRAVDLVNTHLKAWSETDPIKRLSMIREAYTDQIKIIDPGAILSGYQSISEFIGNLHEQNPGFRFTVAKPVEAHHDTAILSWQFGPAGKTDALSGEDVFTFSDGQISVVYVYINGVTKY